MASQTSNSPRNPFDHAFEMLGKIPEVVTDEVNAEALQQLTEALTARAGERGRMILLRSPRAGFGKTHLLMRLHERVAHTHEFISLEPMKGKELAAQSVMDAVLRRFSRILPAGGGLTVLDLLARRILAAGLEPLVKSGEVPSQDREAALLALQTRPVETFDFHNEDAVTAQWAMANFALLGPRLTAELAERTHAGYRPVAWWVELLFRYSSAPVDQATRNSSLFETVFSSDAMETDVHEKLVTLLNLTGLVTSPVLVLDEVEGFSSNPEAALQATTFLNALHQSCDKLALIISVNGDVWETAFLPRIPCGLKDRLSDIVVDLKPMEKETAIKMLRDRAGDKADAIADELDFETGVVYARGLIRCAANAWSDVAADSQDTDQVDDTAEGNDPISLLESDAEAQPAKEEKPVEPAEPVKSPETVALVDPVKPAQPEETVEDITDDQPEPVKISEPQVETPEPPQEVAGGVDQMEPSDGYEASSPAAPSASYQPEPTPELKPEAESEASNLPDFSNLPRPFAQQQPQEEPPAAPTPPQFAQPAPPADPPKNPPKSVVNSPFSIDTSVPAQSPFQPAETLEPSQPTPPTHAPSPFEPAPPVASTPPAENPAESFPPKQQQVPAAPKPHAVTDQDHEKVEDLLRQFRDRYGRD